MTSSYALLHYNASIPEKVDKIVKPSNIVSKKFISNMDGARQIEILQNINPVFPIPTLPALNETFEIISPIPLVIIAKRKSVKQNIIEREPRIISAISVPLVFFLLLLVSSNKKL